MDDLQNHYDDPQKIYAHSKDLQGDPFIKFLDNNFLKLQGVLALILFAVGVGHLLSGEYSSG